MKTRCISLIIYRCSCDGGDFAFKPTCRVHIEHGRQVFRQYIARCFCLIISLLKSKQYLDINLHRLTASVNNWPKEAASSYFATDSSHSLCSVVIAICHELCCLVSPSNPCGTILSKHYRSCLQISKSALKRVPLGRAAGHRICWKADCDTLFLSSLCLYTLLSAPPGVSDLSMTLYTLNSLATTPPAGKL